MPGLAHSKKKLLPSVRLIPGSSGLLDLLLGRDDDGVALHLHVQLLRLVAAAVYRSQIGYFNRTKSNLFP